MTTERLILRKWNEKDAESLFKFAKDPDVGPIAGWPPHKSIEESLAVIRNVFNGKECYAICEKTNGIAIGAIELMLNDKSNLALNENECELGYWLGKPFWGKGYMTEAATEIIRRGFDNLGFERIWCGYFDGNEKSKRVQEKLGFTHQFTIDNCRVGLLNEIRVCHVNALTKEYWKKCHSGK